MNSTASLLGFIARLQRCKLKAWHWCDCARAWMKVDDGTGHIWMTIDPIGFTMQVRVSLRDLLRMHGASL